jgi:hypothetical protein
MDALALDGGRELRVQVEPGLVRTPVVSVTPVADEILDIGSRYTVLPARVWQFIGASGRPAGGS